MKRKANAALGLISSALLAWVSLGGGACGDRSTPIQAACEKACTCLDAQCTATYVDDCVAQAAEQRTAAEASGCGTQFDAFFACLGGEETPCEATMNPCQSEQDALAACGATDPSVCAPSIERIGSALDACGVDSSGVRATMCTDQSAHVLKCQEPCYDSASCDAVTGADTAGGKVFNDCLAACSG